MPPPKKPGAFIFRGLRPHQLPARERAEAVAMADLGTVFSRENPLYAKLEAGL
jgi:hypothetical protein